MPIDHDSIAAVDLSDLRALLEQPGPWATVELPAPRAHVDADDRLAIEWKNAAAELEAAGAPDAVVERLRAAVMAADDDASAIVAHANGSTVATSGLPVALQARRATYAPLPRLMTEIDWRRRAVCHLVVLLDRTGADIIASRWGDEAAITDVEGSHDVIRKPAGGGWSQQRFQRRAEDSWERNAEEVADEVASIAGRHGAEIIIVAGGPRMVPLLRDALPERWQPLVTEIDGHRAQGVELDAMAEDIERVLDDLAARRLAALLSDVDEGGIRGGADDVLSALSRGEVSTLIVSDDPDDARTAWFVPGGFAAAVRADALTGLGADPVEGRLVDVAVRSALLSGAEVVVGPSAYGRELAALLRTT